ncbi:Tn3 family transposase [Inquilinus sp. OTU3971]|uniref:Tn3 family transposase n=1 Tax=Inquilinus sp. OTU3971 TaxID=3043855 RepID=UPI00406C9DCC
MSLRSTWPAARSPCRGSTMSSSGSGMPRSTPQHSGGEPDDRCLGNSEYPNIGARQKDPRHSTSRPWIRCRCGWSYNKDGQLRAEGHDLPDAILRHVSPQIWEHINLTGTYDWNRQDLPPSGAFRPLHRTATNVPAAA